MLFLVQHGKAKLESEDSTRPLSHEGIREVERVGQYLSQHGLPIQHIYHSGKLRAEQTARILADAFPDIEPETVAGLAPGDSPLPWLERLQSEKRHIMVVGHLPHLAHLTALLLTGRLERPVVRFRNSAVLCLDQNERGQWVVNWMITPEILSA